MKKKNVVVITGGLSTERDVSFAMGGQVANALMENGHRVVLLDSFANINEHKSFDSLHNEYGKKSYEYGVPENTPDLDVIMKTRGGSNIIGDNVIAACKTADVCFIAQAGGIGENGQLSAILDLYAIPYTGSDQVGSLLSMDKSLTKIMLQQNGILSPEWRLISSSLSEKEKYQILDTFAMPFIVKPCNGGSSIGIALVKNKDDIEKAFQNIKKYKDNFIVESFIKGRNFTVGILGDRALPSTEIIYESEFNDFKTKYQGLSKKICPSQVSPFLENKLREISLQVHNALKLKGYSRQDFIVSNNNEIYCLESNSRPGMTKTSVFPKEAQAEGISFNDLCEKLINDAFLR